jgi:hypothetical protein
MLTKFLITSRQSLLLSLLWPSCGLGLRIGLTIASQQRAKIMLLAEFNKRESTIILAVQETCKYCNFETSIKERGAFWGSMIGFSVGLLRLILLFAYPADPCVQSDKVTGSLKFLDSQ